MVDLLGGFSVKVVDGILDENPGFNRITNVCACARDRAL